METRKILSTIGTFVAIGAASMAGSALWTNILEDRIKMARAKKTHSNSDKVIVIDFKKARRECR